MAKAPSSDKIVPEAIQHRLQAHGTQLGISEWEIGDIACYLADMYCTKTRKRMFVDKDENLHPMRVLWAAVSDYAGKSPDTIRGFERYSRLVPYALRDAFDVLCRTQHKYLADKVKGDIEAHEALANAWLDYCAQNDWNIESTRGMYAWLKKDEDGYLWKGRLKRARRTVKKLADDEEAPLEVREYSNDYYGQTEAYDD